MKKNIEKTKKVDFWIDQIEILKEEIIWLKALYLCGIDIIGGE